MYSAMSVTTSIAQEHLDEGGLTGAVVAHDAHLLEAGEVVVEVAQDDFFGRPGFGDVLTLEDFRTDVDVLALEAHLPFLDALPGFGLEFVESFLAVAGLVSAGLGLTAHPVEFAAIEVVGVLEFGSAVIHPLLPLFEIIGVVALIGEERLGVELDDEIADAVEEIAVVRHHEQRLVATGEKAFKPLDHFEVEVIGGLVEDEEVGVGDECVSQCYAFLLSAAELPHRLVEVGDFQLRENLFRLQYFLFVALMIETGLEHGFALVEPRRLNQTGHPQSVAIDHLASVSPLLAHEDGEQGGLARSILRNKAHALPFSNGEGDVFEEYFRAEPLGEVLHVENRFRMSHTLLCLQLLVHVVDIGKEIFSTRLLLGTRDEIGRQLLPHIFKLFHPLLSILTRLHRSEFVGFGKDDGERHTALTEPVDELAVDFLLLMPDVDQNKEIDQLLAL